MEPLIYLVMVLVVVGIVLWLVQTFIPIDPRITTAIIVLVVLFAFMWALRILLGPTFPILR